MCKVIVDGYTAGDFFFVLSAQQVADQIKAERPNAVVYLQLDQADMVNLQEQGHEVEFAKAHAHCEAARQATPVEYWHYYQRIIRRTRENGLANGYEWAWQLK